ncbi:MAG: rhomboid family intramembrane serine protease, partial [Acidobacteria bacterium]|nr:rhomboid family intramembrane serine protease [Acidobacteriota bacterium]
VSVPARLVLGIYLVVDNLLPFLLADSSGGGVAHGAHIGGFAAGLAVAWVMSRREVTAKPSTYAAVAGTPAPLVDEVPASGPPDMARVAQAYFALPADQTRRALGADESMALGNWLAANGHTDAALVVFRRHLRDYPSGPTAAAAHVGAGLIQFEQLGQVAPAYQHFLDALDLSPDDATSTRARAALAQIAAIQKYNIGRRPS